MAATMFYINRNLRSSPENNASMDGRLVDLANELSTLQAVRVGKHRRYGLLLENRRGSNPILPSLLRFGDADLRCPALR